MPRRYKSTDPLILPDPVFNSKLASKIVNKIMWGGKKTTAQKVFYEALGLAQKKLANVEQLDLFTQAVENVKPLVEVRSRRVGGATSQVPVEVRPERAQALAIRWLITAARGRAETTMAARLSGELMDAANNRGTAVKKREDTHKMAEANRAFAHYRW
jgi:small subunit ribosomal protein S7